MSPRTLPSPTDRLRRLFGALLGPLLLAPLVVLYAACAEAAETTRFAAEDGVEVTADRYPAARPGAPALVLFHMAGSSRGEYREIAPRLQAMGYDVLAVDQRSGGAFDGVRNETAARVGRDQGYAAAIPDLKAAVAYARGLGATRIGVVGSSYSASLALALAGRDPGFADAVAAFSPGEYFSPGDFVRRDAAGIAAPIFVTGARNEERQWRPIFEAAPGPKTGFVPSGSGRHGATVLITADGAEYWAAFEAFLEEALPVAPEG